MNKKIGSIIICILMAISLVNTNINNVIAEDNNNQTEQEKISGKFSDSVKWELDGTVLTISGEGAIWSADTASVSQYRPTQVIIGEGITSIEDNTFYNFGSLERVTIADSVTNIGNSAFRFCSGLVNVTIPKNVANIGNGCFADCDNLERIDVDSENQKYTSYKGALYTKDMSTIVTYPAQNKEMTVMESLENVTTIGSSAFNKCQQITSIEIPSHITHIENNAFRSCKNLTSVVIPDGVKTIEEGTFSFCEKLQKVTLHQNMTRIGNDAFYGCKSLTSIDIPDTVTEIGYSAFRETNIENITIPKNVKSIGYRTFQNCKSLKTVDILGDISIIEDNLFNGCTSLTKVTLPNSVTTIENEVFKNCTSLSSVFILDGVTHIYYDAFVNCTGLTSLTIPKSVEYIGSGAIPNNSQINIFFEDEATALEYIKNNKIESKIHLFSLNKDEMTMTVGDTNDLAVVAKEISSSGTKDESVPVTWTSDNESVVTVENGVITAKAKGSATITVTNQDGGYATCFVEVDPLSIETFTVTLSEDTFTYSGNENRPEVTVKNGDAELVKDTDYTVTYENNINAGQATVKIQGQGNYTGTIKKVLTIEACPINDYDVELSQDTFVYNGKDNKTTVTVKDENTVLKEGVDYTVTYENNVNVGKATMIIQGQGNYTGAIQKALAIEACSINDYDVELSQETFGYNGKEIQPSVTVKDGNTVLKEGTDYTVTYKNNVQVGTAQVIVTGIGNYEGTLTKTFTIQSKVVVSPSDKDDVQIDVDKKVDGYGDLSDKTQETIQESTKDFLEKNYSNELKALPSGSKIETDVSIKLLDASQLTQEQKDKMKKALKNGAYVLAYYDISVLATAYTKEGNVISGLNHVAITQLDNSIQISITIPNEYLKANRKFGILRLHDGQVAELSSNVKDNVITFNTDCFSIYALTGEDMNGTVNTGDNLSTTLPFIAMGVSAMLIVGLYMTRKKKTE